MALTPKQENFCLAYLETGNASEAYRRAYDAEAMSGNAIAVEACLLLDNPKVSLRLSELREPIMQRHAITVDVLLEELEEARQLAMNAATPQSAAAVGATMGKAKLLGMDKQVLEHTGPGGAPLLPTTILLAAPDDNSQD